MPRYIKITAKNALWQQLDALRRNREKRSRLGLFLLEGVHPIENAIGGGFEVEMVAYAADRRLSGWANDMIKRSNAGTVCEMSGELHAELSDRDEPCELIMTVKTVQNPLERLKASVEKHKKPFLVLFDRPSSPGNLGTLLRSADAFGASGVITCGHSADFYDPQCVRASIGALFRIPFANFQSMPSAVEWIESQNTALPLIGTSAHGQKTLCDVDFTGPFTLLIGNETFGLSAAWKQAAKTLARIPINGSVSSLNAGCAATVCLYEIGRQRGFPTDAQ